jgi:hypothetical protein
MRVLVDIEDRHDELFVIVTAPGGLTAERPVTWAGDPGSAVSRGKRLLVAKGTTIADPAALADAVDQGQADDELLKEYGSLLFGAAFGTQLWQELLASTAGQPYLELAIRGLATADQAAMQALRWEALHDGSGAVAAQGAARAGGGTVPVGIVRLVPRSRTAGVPARADVNAAAAAQVAAAPVQAAPAPAAPMEPAPAEFQPIARIPRVLFAIGSHLTDPKVRAGAEFMGIMRHLERDGGSIHPRVLQEATRSKLVEALTMFRPDVVHFIGHGRRFPDGSVKLQLHPDAGMKPGEEYVTAEQLLAIFAEARHTPMMALLSACQTASGGPGGAAAAGGTQDRVNALPFAARLVAGNNAAENAVAGSAAAGGVPVVVAMAGDISDTASRVFTRALTAAIGAGTMLGKAVVIGRRAAFYGGSRSRSGDWIMPALFLAEHVTGATCLVDTAAQDAARSRVRLLSMAVEPVFCGRATFITALDRLLDGDDPLNVLLAYAPNPSQHFGGKRLLRELGARAVRSGVLPVLLGPYDQGWPTTRLAVAEAISDQIENIREKLGLPERDSRALAVAEAEAAVHGAAAGAGPAARMIRRRLARAIREDIDALVADLPDDDPVKSHPAGQPRVILLCHRVDKWIDALDDLLGGLLDSTGLSGGTLPVPVVLTGADIDPLQETRLRAWNGLSWAWSEPLDRFTTHDEEDILAYLWWLLNPPPKEHVYAVSRTALPAWPQMLRLYLRNSPLYPADDLFVVAKTMSDYFTSGNDDELLASYAKALP